MKSPIKNVFWFAVLGCALAMPSAEVRGQVAATTPAETISQLSPGALEILKLVNADVNQGVLLGFIGNTMNPFNLTADDLIYLQNNGVPSNVTTAMLQRDQALRQATPGTQVGVPSPTGSNPPVGQPVMASPVTINEGQPAVPQFYAALLPYGSWFQLPDSGWVWQPKEAAANPDWRPYLDGGRWEWTDHGWYWESDYPWGWAAFHYGRWLQMEKLGWVWFPDTVWAPSWVTWRYHDDNVGWAPLPPNALVGHTVIDQPVVNNYDYGVQQHSYTFVDVRYIFVRNVRPHCLPPRRVKEFYSHCKVVNDFAPGRNHGVVNRGIPIERIADRTGKHFTPVPVLKPGLDPGKDPIARRSPGAQPFVPLPYTRDDRSGTRTPSSTYSLPAAPRLPSAPGTPSPAASVNLGYIASPMNPIVPPINPGTTPVNPTSPGNHNPGGNRMKAFTPVVPAHVGRPAVPSHPGHGHGDRDKEKDRKRDQTHQNPGLIHAPPAAAAPSTPSAPGKKGWSIAAPHGENPATQHPEHSKQQHRARK